MRARLLIALVVGVLALRAGAAAPMYAAQLDVLDAAKQLLAAGADVNAVTKAPDEIVGNEPFDPETPYSGCSGTYAITHGRRTALM